MLTIWKFDHLKNNHSLYFDKYCMKKFCTPTKNVVNNIGDENR